MKLKWDASWRIIDGPSENNATYGTSCCSKKVPWYCVQTNARHLHICHQCMPPYLLVLYGLTKEATALA